MAQAAATRGDPEALKAFHFESGRLLQHVGSLSAPGLEGCVQDATARASSISPYGAGYWADYCMRRGRPVAWRDGWSLMTVSAPTTGAEAASDDELLSLIAAGDRRAFQCLMERHARSVMSLAERMTGSPSDADEIAQEVFIKVWQAAAKWRVDGTARFSTWLYRVALNLCLDRRRRRPMDRLDDHEEPEDPSQTAFEVVATRQQRMILHAAMAKLPERQRAALSLHYFSEMPAREAAEVLEMSASALESLLIRGKRTLKKVLIGKGVAGIGDMV